MSSAQRSREGIATEDWPDALGASQSAQGQHGHHVHGKMREQGLNTGVRVNTDGRLDIKFREHKPWLAKLLQHIERQTPDEPKHKRSLTPAEKESFPLHLNIVIQVVGSRGDVQPFVALGQALRAHGHRVRLATHLAFRDYILENDLEFFCIGGDPAELMAFMVKNPGLMPDMRTIRSGAIRKRRREMKAIFSGCWRACFETGDGTGMHHIPDDPWSETGDPLLRPFVADAIIANPPSFAHLSCAEKLGVPLNMMFTMPWSATQSFPHPLANIQSRNTKPSAANFASYAVVEVMIWEGLGDLINRFRKRDLGLDPLDAIRAPSIAHRLHIPYTYLWSPALLPKPKDWPDNIDVSGFSFLSSGSDYSPPAELADFLKAGPPPIYIGFGSIVVDNPTKLTEIVFSAVRATGQRAIVSKGWGNIGADLADVPENILLLGKCPHDWLFQHVSCVVHHGGAGTTAAGLVLGKPTVIVPFFGDQPFWGSIVARAGAGPLPVPYKELTAEKLCAAIQEAQGEEVLAKARKIGARMREEDGVKDAVCSFHRHLNVDSLRCSICPDRAAVWMIRRSHIRLSPFAAAVLVETGLVKTVDVVLYRSKDYDTNRDPKGPISAGAAVLYGVVTDFISGVADFPSDMVDMFQHHPHGHHKERIDCEPYFKKYREGRRNSPSPASSHTQTQSQSQSQSHASPSSPTQEDETTSDENDYISAEESPSSPSSSSTPTPPTNDPEATYEAAKDIDLGVEMDLERTLTSHQSKDRSSARVALSETRYHAGRLGKHILNSVILIPTDLTLSLSKGFHNAPKLYHDRMVRETPRVLGVRSGVRAAGTEFSEGFYYGITGLVTQPARGLSKSGATGLAKGVGKGIGGVILKPAAGIWGLAGYPLDGLHKTLRNSLSKNKTKEILKSRIAQGMEEMCAASTEERARVIKRWHELQGEETQ